MSKLRIINDPVYGFIPIPNELIFSLIEHSFFQRMRRIKQLGLTHLVYPGALHTRFHHSLGSMYLMREAIQVLRERGIEISEQESEGALIAILLHDLGHGPFSHSLESAIVRNIGHEHLTGLFLNELNKEYDDYLPSFLAAFKHTLRAVCRYTIVECDVDDYETWKRNKSRYYIRLISYYNIASNL
ncbi:MAG: HD domain-containing protein, partial [Bacteroidales bacterium]|nr:HD domain-containing protein [Bacteroidales bacterium]